MLLKKTYKILNPGLRMSPGPGGRAAEQAAPSWNKRQKQTIAGSVRRPPEGGVVRILITEDDSALAEALQFSLSQAGYAVDWVPNGAAADEVLKDDVFGLLILDLGLPKLDGFEVLRRLRRRNDSLPVLILSGRERPEEKVRGLDLGADDYLVKPFSLNELQARVRALLRRRQQAGAAPMILYGELGFDTVSRTVSVKGKTLPLSVHETGVLEVLMRRFGRIVSKEQLVEQLYNYDREVSQNAIEVYVHRLRKKIGDGGVTLRTLYGQGYMLDYISH
jgi:two-component system OmpR family response regulator